jgi:DNA-binding NarL/FixJ family response regulator
VTEAAAEPGSHQQVLRVLLCDDDPVMSGALTDLFRDNEGFDLVGVAGDADTAAALAEQLEPDVVLLDVRMPGGGGPRAARLIRNRVRGARLVAFSAHSDRQTVLGMIRAGVTEYLVKGIDGEGEIIEALRRTGHGRLRLAPAEAEQLVLDLIDLLTLSEARLDAANENLVRLGADARTSAANTVSLIEAALERRDWGTGPDDVHTRESLQLALASGRHVIDCLAAASVVVGAPLSDPEMDW